MMYFLDYANDRAILAKSLIRRTCFLFPYKHKAPMLVHQKIT